MVSIRWWKYMLSSFNVSQIRLMLDMVKIYAGFTEFEAHWMQECSLDLQMSGECDCPW